jgi:hypothetical protein
MGLHGVTSQTTAFFIVTAVRTSDPTCGRVDLIYVYLNQYVPAMVTAVAV